MPPEDTLRKKPDWVTPSFAGGTKENLLARVPRRRPKAFAEAGITHNDIDYLMIYDAPVRCAGQASHLPIYCLEDLGFVPRGEAGAFIAGHNPAPGGKLPLNTNGSGLS